MTDDEVRAYLNGLKPGEKVIETGNSCMRGKTGVVYIGKSKISMGTVCVRWSDGTGTSATWGTRRISDLKD